MMTDTQNINTEARMTPTTKKTFFDMIEAGDKPSTAARKIGAVIERETVTIPEHGTDGIDRERTAWPVKLDGEVVAYIGYKKVTYRKALNLFALVFDGKHFRADRITTNKALALADAITGAAYYAGK